MTHTHTHPRPRASPRVPRASLPLSRAISGRPIEARHHPSRHPLSRQALARSLSLSLSLSLSAGARRRDASVASGGGVMGGVGRDTGRDSGHSGDRLGEDRLGEGTGPRRHRGRHSIPREAPPVSRPPAVFARGQPASPLHHPCPPTQPAAAHTRSPPGLPPTLQPSLSLTLSLTSTQREREGAAMHASA